MFKIVAAPTFTASVPLARPGEPQTVPVVFTFRHKGKRALADYLDRGRASADDQSYLDEVIEAWQGVADAEGKPLAYSRDALSVLLDNFPAAGAQIVAAYVRELTNARLGN